MQVGSVQAKTTSLIVQPAKAAKASSLAYYAPADTNKDGVVSAAEALAYALKHPELGARKAANAASTHNAQSSANPSPLQYSQRATLNRATQAQHGLLDLKA
jgi:hypothetical protein